MEKMLAVSRGFCWNMCACRAHQGAIATSGVRDAYAILLNGERWGQLLVVRALRRCGVEEQGDDGEDGLRGEGRDEEEEVPRVAARIDQRLQLHGAEHVGEEVPHAKAPVVRLTALALEEHHDDGDALAK